MSNTNNESRILDALPVDSFVDFVRRAATADQIDVSVGLHAESDELFEQCNQYKQVIREIDQIRLAAEGTVDDGAMLDAVELLEQVRQETPQVHILASYSTQWTMSERAVDPANKSDAQLRLVLFGAHGQPYGNVRIVTEESSGVERWVALYSRSVVCVRIAPKDEVCARVPVECGVLSEATEQLTLREECGWPKQGLAPVLEQVVFL